MQPPRHYQVGNLRLSVISDGFIKLDAGAVFGLVPRIMWEPVIGAESIDADYRVQLALNCVVVRSGNHVVLLDTGIGNKHSPVVARGFPGDYGHLLKGLDALGLAPGDITAVANTHLHADHCGWNTIRRGDEVTPTFPNARYFVQAGEYETAMHPNERTRGTYFAENFEPLARSGQLELVDGEREIAPGMHFLPTPGHTADHAAIVLASGGETAIFTGDLIHHEVQIERPTWIPAFDVLPLVTLDTKKKLIERAMRENALLVSVHSAFPGVGRLREINGRRTWVNE